MAGYQRLVEIVETIFEDYTEFRYRTEAVEETEFVPLRLGYLPEGMKEVERDETTISLDVVYQGKQKEYVRIDQRIMRENDKTTYVIDMEKVPAGLDPARRKNIKFIYQEKYEEEQNNVIWI